MVEIDSLTDLNEYQKDWEMKLLEVFEKIIFKYYYFLINI